MKRTQKIILGSGLVAVVAVSLGVGFWFQQPTRTFDTVGYELDNITNNSLYVQNGGYEITRGHFGELIVTDTKTGKQVSIEADPYYINATEKGIYFEDVMEGNRLIKVDYKTKQKEIMVDKEVTNVLAYDQNLYYSSFNEDNKIYRISEDGGEAQVLTEEGSISFFIDENQLYYAALEDGLYRLNFHTNQKEKIADGDFWRITKDDQYIYYIKSFVTVGELYRIHPETGKEEKLVDDRIVTYHLLNNEILYSVSDEGKDIGLYLLDLETMTSKKLSDFNAFGMYEKDGKIYMKRYYDRQEMVYDIQTKELLELPK